VVLGGSVGRKEATGQGVIFMVEEAAKHLGMDLAQSTAVIQGFGNVGSHAALFLDELDTKIIGISDVSGGLFNDKGFHIEELLGYAAEHGSLEGYSECDRISNSELLELSCDVLVPAAIENQITAGNADRIKCKILAEGANGPTTTEADEILNDRGVFVVPDILANAGGVTVSYFEWVQGTQNYMWTLDEINSRLRKIMTRAFHEVLHRAQEDDLDLRTASLVQGIERVTQAKLKRGLFP
jgi:glutamate dehydrogenase (NAD(P)+)